MSKKSIKLCRYVAGAIFLFSLINSIFSVSGITFWLAAEWIATMLMAVSMFTKIFPLLAAGAGIYVVRSLVSIIKILSIIVNGDNNIQRASTLVYHILLFIAYSFVIAAVFQKKSATKISLIVAILLVIGCIVQTIPLTGMVGYAGYLLSRLQGIVLLFCEPFILAGYIMQAMTREKHAKVFTAGAKAENYSERIEKLTKFKELLDIGVISQEEFEAKKKQLLGL